MDKETIARNQELLNKFRPKEYNTMSDFEKKVNAKSNERIAPGAKTTYRGLHEYDEMSKRSIAESNEKRRKIKAVEKRKKDTIRLLIHAGLLLLSVILTALLAKGPGKGKAFDHNGDIVNIEEVYNPGR